MLASARRIQFLVGVCLFLRLLVAAVLISGLWRRRVRYNNHLRHFLHASVLDLISFCEVLHVLLLRIKVHESIRPRCAFSSESQHLVSITRRCRLFIPTSESPVFLLLFRRGRIRELAFQYTGFAGMASAAWTLSVWPFVRTPVYWLGSRRMVVTVCVV